MRAVTARGLFLRHEWLRGYGQLTPTLAIMVCALALPIFTLVVDSRAGERRVGEEC